ncbi:hypothetical protein [Paenibacillus sp. FSL R10-2736]|uniref:hypothetical protein n=1 Tax=Paenibacillus sp. FSL R10-2736 TaxID=2954692 RepID=UPI0030F5873B
MKDFQVRANNANSHKERFMDGTVYLTGIFQIYLPLLQYLKEADRLERALKQVFCGNVEHWFKDYTHLIIDVNQGFLHIVKSVEELNQEITRVKAVCAPILDIPADSLDIEFGVFEFEDYEEPDDL